MKVVGRIVENLVTEKVNIGNMQFGLVPVSGTTDVIFSMRQLQNRKSCILHLLLIRAPREVVWPAMREAGLEE